MGELRGPVPPPELTAAVQLACVLEVSAPKPGNVTPQHAFQDARYEDFLLSAAAIAPELGRAAEHRVGELVLRSVQATRRRVTSNTNLGIVLLLAPLARAAATAGTPLRPALSRVLAELDVADAEAAFAAIRLAHPGGLGEAPAQDVRERPTVTLREAMAMAAARDTIASEYVTDFAATWEIGLPALGAARAAGHSWSTAALECYLALLARLPDTLIARKRGEAEAERVRSEAARARDAGPTGSPERAAALARLDGELRRAGNELNPGTTADLTAAALMIGILEDPHPVAGAEA